LGIAILSPSLIWSIDVLFSEKIPAGTVGIGVIGTKRPFCDLLKFSAYAVCWATLKSISLLLSAISD